MKQITILTDAQGDIIAEVTELLAQAQVNINSIAGDQYGTQSVVNISVDNETSALEALNNRHDWQVISEDALLIRIEDELGALAKLSQRFSKEKIKLRSIRFVERHKGYALVAIATDEPEKAKSFLADYLVG